MSSRIKLVQNDTLPTITVAMVDRGTWAPVNVSDPTTNVLLKFRAADTTTVLTTITATKLPGQLLSDGSVDASVVTPGLGGRVLFSWPPGALNVPVGYYEGEIEIHLGTDVQTVYDRLLFYVREDA